jgi:hypothetical protein
MKKTTLLALMMILAVLVFAACGPASIGRQYRRCGRDKDGVHAGTLVSSLLKNPVVVSEENLEALIGNNGEFISVEADSETTTTVFSLKRALMKILLWFLQNRRRNNRKSGVLRSVPSFRGQFRRHDDWGKRSWLYSKRGQQALLFPAERRLC